MATSHYNEKHPLTLFCTVYPKKYAHCFCFAVLCCGYTLTDFPISIRPTSLTLWQSNDCPSASKATLMNMDKYFMWIHYERLHSRNKAKHNKTVCIFLGIYCMSMPCSLLTENSVELPAAEMCWQVDKYIYTYISFYLGQNGGNTSLSGLFLGSSNEIDNFAFQIVWAVWCTFLLVKVWNWHVWLGPGEKGETQCISGPIHL